MQLYPINQLYEFTPKVESRSSARRNPLTYEGALSEAEFVDMRLSPQRSRLGILFDTRLCEDFEGSNTALIVLTGAGKVQWSNDDTARRHTWHAEYGSLAPRTAVWAEAQLPLSHFGDENMWALDASDTPKGVAASLSTPKIGESSSMQYLVAFGSLSVSALNGQIYIGHIDGLNGAIPDMTELSDAEIIAGFPQWSSMMEVHEHYTHVA